MAKKKQWGGEREGSGRKPIYPEGRMKFYPFEHTPDAIAKLDKLAKKLKVSRAALIRQIIDEKLAEFDKQRARR